MSAVEGSVAISYGKGAFCVWVGSSVDNADGRSTQLLESAPNFNETVHWFAGDCARKCKRFYLSLTIVRTDATYCGSVAVAVEPSKISADEQSIRLPLMAPTSGDTCRKAACGCLLTITSRYKLSPVDQIPVSSHCRLVVAEQSYPYPTCTRDGWGVLGQLARSMPQDATVPMTRFEEECVFAVRYRWVSYVFSACFLLGYSSGNDMESEETMQLLLAVALQRAASCYTLEKIDDRGPTEICFGMDEDCDGQSASVALFANALIALDPELALSVQSRGYQVAGHLRKSPGGTALFHDAPTQTIKDASGNVVGTTMPDQYEGLTYIYVHPPNTFPETVHALATRLHEFLRKRYTTAAVVFGMAKSPKRGRTGASFGHAYVSLLATPKTEARDTCLNGALIIEATAPISPHLRKDDLTDAGVLLNEDANRREKIARKSRPHARQIVIGVRQAKEWYYGAVHAIFTALWSVSINGSSSLHKILTGASKLSISSPCRCGSKGDRDSMLLTLNRWYSQMRMVDKPRSPSQYGSYPRIPAAVASVRRSESIDGGHHDVDLLSLNAYVQLDGYAFKRVTCDDSISNPISYLRQRGYCPIQKISRGLWLVSFFGSGR